MRLNKVIGKLYVLIIVILTLGSIFLGVFLKDSEIFDSNLANGALSTKVDPFDVYASVGFKNFTVKENTGSVVDNKPFRSTSDLVENAIILLKEKLESKK